LKIDKLNLLSKGWSVAEIENASKIIQEAEDKKHIGAKFLDKTIYWALLGLLIIVNAACSMILIPFIFAIQNNFVIVIVTVMGFIFGVLFSILIADIQKTEKESRNKLILTMLVSGVINFGLIINFSTQFAFETGIALRHNPWVIGGIYLFAFMTPHVMLIIQKYRKQ
jgi:hypothetical protein